MLGSPTVQLAISHDLDDAAAHAAVDKAFAHYGTRYAAYKPHIKWRDGERADLSLSAKGVTLKGHLTLTPKRVLIEVKVPLLLRPFTKKAVSVVETEMQKWLPGARRA
jgi:hypothetical protein